MCSDLVPHPSNRGGEPVRTTRTKALAGEIIDAGYDLNEGIGDHMAVEVDFDPNGDPSCFFSDHFMATSGMDSDHYFDRSSIILFGGLSHNHLTVTERNMLNGMPGCACDQPASNLDQCSCKAKPILDNTCRYSMSKLKKADKDLVQCHRGRQRVGDPKLGH